MLAQQAVKIVITIPLAIISAAGIIGYFYISFGRLYEKREDRLRIGLLAFGLPMIALMSGIGILLIWNPLAIGILELLLLLSAVTSIILWQSIISPYKMADWWTKMAIKLNKKKSENDEQ